jgi:hypothetical protein
MSAAYGLFAPNPIVLLSFIYIIPLGVSVGLVASAVARLDRDAQEGRKP